MPRTVVEQADCQQCGAAIRENTTFCYSCGNRLAAEGTEKTEPVSKNGTAALDDDARAALDDLEAKFKTDAAEDDKLAKAAAERKKARVRRQRPKEVVWEPRDDSSNLLVIVVATIITVAAAIIVLLTVVWR